MILPNLFFFSGLSFLLGVFLASFGSFSLLSVAAIFTLFKNKRVVALLLSCFLLGFFYYLATTSPPINPLTDIPNTQKQGLVAEIISGAKPTKYGERYLAKLLEPKNVKLYLYSKEKQDLLYGDRILVSELKRLERPYQGIYFQTNLIETMKLAPNNSFLRRVYVFKSLVQERLSRLFDRPESELLGGVIYGEQPSYEFKQKMIRSGTLHLAVVSGQNITLMTRIIERTLIHLPLAQRLRLGVVGVFISLLALFVGPEPATLRAVFMGIIVIVIGYIGRIPLRRNILLLAAVILTLLEPSILRFDLGFWLSFLAVIGIFYLSPILENNIRSQILRETISAQLMTLPLILYAFGNLSLNSLISNVLLLPLIPYTMVGGLVVLVIGFLSLTIAQLPAFLLALLLKYEVLVIEFFSSFGFFQFKVPLVAMLAAYSLIFWFIYQNLKGKVIDFNFRLRSAKHRGSIH